MYREQVREKQSLHARLCPRAAVVREALIFPYLAGAEFMHWWGRPRAGHIALRSADAGVDRADPASGALRRGDQPAVLAFPPDSNVLHEDVLGESEIRVLLASLAGSDEVQTVVPIGWGGDRFRVYDTAAGPALVWYVVWDDQRSADRFVRTAGPALRRTARPGYRAVFEPVTVTDRPAVRYVLAPDGWARWANLPEAVVQGK